MIEIWLWASASLTLWLICRTLITCGRTEQTSSLLRFRSWSSWSSSLSSCSSIRYTQAPYILLNCYIYITVLTRRRPLFFKTHFWKNTFLPSSNVTLSNTIFLCCSTVVWWLCFVDHHYLKIGIVTSPTFDPLLSPSLLPVVLLL